jgi:predicted LPLAT superfamily acyltransferase
MGNWELAGQLLERIPTPVNIVMLEAEREQIRDLLEKVMVEKKLKVIPQKDDYTHLFLIDEALDRKEFVVIHGDRYLPGAATQLLPFMGRDARFPTGPLYLASKKGVPVSFVFTLKERKSHYHFYATPPVQYPYPSRPRTRREELARMLEDYVRVLENMVRAYPFQWFNFYPFWEEEKKSA